MYPDENSFHDRVVAAIKAVPRGKVATYGQIAAFAGSPRAARQVVRVLHSSSRKHKLPWHRIINSQGRISLKRGEGYEEQKARLTAEGVKFSRDDRIDLAEFLWEP
jgi:methylated-DNA-protein-cysteine methyltransferase-like protein